MSTFCLFFTISIAQISLIFLWGIFIYLLAILIYINSLFTLHKHLTQKLLLKYKIVFLVIEKINVSFKHEMILDLWISFFKVSPSSQIYGKRIINDKSICPCRHSRKLGWISKNGTEKITFSLDLHFSISFRILK